MNHLYCKLSTIERLTLYLRACGRSDNKEAEAVLSASPRLDMSGPDFFPHVLALEFMIFHHWLSQIDTLLAFISATLALKSNCAEALAVACHFADKYLTVKSFSSLFAMNTDSITISVFRSLCQIRGRSGGSTTAAFSKQSRKLVGSS